MDFIQKNNSVTRLDARLKTSIISLNVLIYVIKLRCYQNNDLPLIIKYNVASLGEIKLGLSQLPCVDTD